MLFSHVKISMQVLARKLTWYFIGVYITKKNIILQEVNTICDIAKSLIVHREMKLFNVYFLVWL